MMRDYLIKRVIQLIPLIIGIICMDFIIIHLAPGDPTQMLGGELTGAPPEYQEKLRKELGLDKPLWEQLLIYMKTILSGNFGYSFVYRSSVFNLIMERVPNTLILIFSSMLFSIVIGILLGINAAKKPYSLVDNITTSVSLLGYSIPNFWLGVVLLLVFSLYLGMFPIQGMYTLGVELTGLDYVIDVLRHLFLPMIVLGTSQLAMYTRLIRTSMLEVLDQDYILTARAKGCNESQILYDHALKNALLPTVTVIGLNLGFILTGSILTETVFAWPGIGRLMYDAIFVRDYPILLGIFTLISMCVVFATLLTDITYAFLDPRIRYGKG
jgi:peptide/nickel transport system permease protein